jgi:hypothetical protein
MARLPRRPRRPTNARRAPVTAVPSIAAPQLVVDDFQPLSRSVIFALIWMALVGAYLFNGPRNFTVSTEVSWLIVGATAFSLIALGRRFPLFGYCTIIILCGFFTALVGGRRGRR